jgi:hypothetical protein
MQLPESVKAIRTRYVAKYPVPNAPPDIIDNLARQWTIRFAEQVAFELPGQGWAVKRGDSGRPICKDCIARKTGDGLLTWDLLMGTGTGSPSLVENPESLDVSPGTPDGGTNGQFYENRPNFFQPQDHLKGIVIPPPVPVGKPLDAYIKFGHALDQIYFEELGRHLSDTEAVPNWVFHWRENGKDEAWIRARIRESEEWKAGHQ